MHWTNIHDPKGEIEIRAELSRLEQSYKPAAIQKMIDDHGFEEMIRTVNEQFQSARVNYFLQLIESRGRKILTGYSRTIDLILA